MPLQFKTSIKERKLHLRTVGGIKIYYTFKYLTFTVIYSGNHYRQNK